MSIEYDLLKEIILDFIFLREFFKKFAKTGRFIASDKRKYNKIMRRAAVLEKKLDVRDYKMQRNLMKEEMELEEE